MSVSQHSFRRFLVGVLLVGGCNDHQHAPPLGCVPRDAGGDARALEAGAVVPSCVTIGTVAGGPGDPNPNPGEPGAPGTGIGGATGVGATSGVGAGTGSGSGGSLSAGAGGPNLGSGGTPLLGVGGLDLGGGGLGQGFSGSGN